MSLHFSRVFGAAKALTPLLKTVAPFAAAFIPGIGPGAALALRAAGAVSAATDIYGAVRGFRETAGESAVVGTPLMMEATGQTSVRSYDDDDGPTEEELQSAWEDDNPPED
jgi:hypothetical protein